MKQGIASVVLTLAALASSQSPQSAERWFATGAPELVTANVALTPLLDWAEYAKLTGNLKGPRFVPLTERPPLSDNARFAVNFVLGGQNRALAIDGSPAAGHTLYLDLDGDGKLTGAESMPMKQTAGKFTATYHADLTDASSGSPDTYPVDMTFALDTAVLPGGTAPAPVVRRCNTTVRRGVARLSSGDVAFALLGHSGIYDGPSAEVIFDLRGRGLDLTDDRSPDRYQVRDGKVTIAGAAYAFRVDRYGRALALAATGAPAPPRPTLETGTLAPDFAFTDLDGGRHKLSDYRGKVVLVVFWATWCGPCRAEAPVIADVHAKYKDQGLVVLGVNPNDPIADVKGFIDQFHVAGLTARESMDDAAHKLFRVTAWPTHFLIGRDGRILANEIDVKRLADTVAAAIRRGGP